MIRAVRALTDDEIGELRAALGDDSLQKDWRWLVLCLIETIKQRSTIHGDSYRSP